MAHGEVAAMSSTAPTSGRTLGSGSTLGSGPTAGSGPTPGSGASHICMSSSRCAALTCEGGNGRRASIVVEFPG
eukprot:50857-Chlamydomonas_euryale.AAC.2